MRRTAPSAPGTLWRPLAAGTLTIGPPPGGGQRPPDAPLTLAFPPSDPSPLPQPGPPTMQCSPATTARGCSPASRPLPATCTPSPPLPGPPVYNYPRPTWGHSTGPTPIRPLPGRTMGVFALKTITKGTRITEYQRPHRSQAWLGTPGQNLTYIWLDLDNHEALTRSGQEPVIIDANPAYTIKQDHIQSYTTSINPNCSFCYRLRSLCPCPNSCKHIVHEIPLNAYTWVVNQPRGCSLQPTEMVHGTTSLASGYKHCAGRHGHAG